MPIIHEARYFGPGLPEEGTTDPVVAFNAGMEHHKTARIRQFLRTQNWSSGEHVSAPNLAAHIHLLKMVADQAGEEFIRDNPSLSDAATLASLFADAPETPPDPPSLDTTFHDHEIDVDDDPAIVEPEAPKLTSTDEDIQF